MEKMVDDFIDRNAEKEAEMDAHDEDPNAKTESSSN
jgi:hypothetical protein